MFLLHFSFRSSFPVTRTCNKSILCLFSQQSSHNSIYILCTRYTFYLSFVGYGEEVFVQRPAWCEWTCGRKAEEGGRVSLLASMKHIDHFTYLPILSSSYVKFCAIKRNWVSFVNKKNSTTCFYFNPIATVTVLRVRILVSGISSSVAVCLRFVPLRVFVLSLLPSVISTSPPSCLVPPLASPS